MNVKALMDCKGVGYDLKKGEETDLPKHLAELLVRFGYVEKIEKSKKESEK
jgi:hypothetical protein